MPRTVRFSAVAIENLEDPRPHYRVQVRGTVTGLLGAVDHTAGLLPEDVAMTVRLPTDIGSDLPIIREAAARRARKLLEILIESCRESDETTLPAEVKTGVADAGLR